MRRSARRWVVVLTVVTVGVALAASASARTAGNGKSPGQSGHAPKSHRDIKHDVSPPLRDIPPARIVAPHQHPDAVLPTPPASSTGDPVVQTSTTTASAPAITTNFEGVGLGFSGPQGAFTLTGAPPDSNGTLGPSDYFDLVNTEFAIFTKTGGTVYGPVPTNTLWSGFGGECQDENDGDGIVVYDPIADRWIVSQFALGPGNGGPYFQCVAVSTGGDPTGSYYRYAFSYDVFPDYPKMGVWPDAYYETFNTFNSSGTAFLGGNSCAYDRASMLIGASATQQCFPISTNFGSAPLPADLDGTTPPPAGEPNTQVGLGRSSSTLSSWEFHVDWSTPANSTYVETDVSVDPYTTACSGGNTPCIPQPGTSQQLDSLADRLMYRLAYRNLAGSEYLVVSHSVTTNSGTTGERWYELQISGGGVPVKVQDGTYAGPNGPDSTSRWMGSVAMDQNQDIALGMSASSSTIHPSVIYTGRLAGNTLGTMTQGEGTLLGGSGSQNGGLSRWGDYSAMEIDPVDGCTFYYTNEYLASDGSFNWQTRIGSFKLSSTCAATSASFSMNLSPVSSSGSAGGSNTTSTTISTTTVGSAGTVNLAVTDPPGGSSSLSSSSVASGGSATLNITSPTSPGTYRWTVTGTEGSVTRQVTYTRTVLPSGVTNGGFETGDLSGWTAGVGTTGVSSTAHSGNFSARLGSTTPTSGDSSISQTFGVPSGAGSLSFWYQVHCPDTLTFDWATATLTDNTTGSTTTLLNPTCTNTGNWVQSSPYGLNGAGGHSVTLTLTSHDDNWPSDPTYTLYDDVVLTGSNTSDFSLSASPASQTVAQGSSKSYSVTVSPSGSFSGSVTLSVSGLPTGAGGTFLPNPATSTSNLNVTTSSTTPTGSYPLTITGTSGALTHTTGVTLVVNSARDFSLSRSPSSQTVTAGNGTSYTITVTPSGGFSGSVSLSVSGLPTTGATGSFSLNPAMISSASATSSTLTVTTSETTPGGTYPLTVTGTSGSLSHTTSVTLVVQNFSLSSSPTSGSVRRGGSTTYTITMTPSGGFTGPVTPSVTGLATGETPSWSSTSLTPGAPTTTLTITTNSSTTPTGTRTLTITGTGTGTGLSHSITVTLSVSKH